MKKYISKVVSVLLSQVLVLTPLQVLADEQLSTSTSQSSTMYNQSEESTSSSNKQTETSATQTTTNSTESSIDQSIVKSNENSLNIKNVPQYVFYDPQTETLTNENGKTNFSLEGTWSSFTKGANEFNIQIGGFNNPINDWYWYGGNKAELTLQNTNQENALNYNLSTILSSNVENFKNIPTTKKIGIMF